MIRILLTVLFLVGFETAANCQVSQLRFENVNAASLKDSFHSDKPKVFFLTAYWCHPCMQKTVTLFKENKDLDTSFSYAFIFDYTGIKMTKLSEWYHAGPSTAQLLLLDRGYYKIKGLININVQDKALKKFVHDVKNQFQSNLTGDIDKTWFGTTVFIRSGDKLAVEHIEANETNVTAVINSLLENYKRR